MWTAEEAGRITAEWMKVGYRTDPAKLDKLLPPGFSLGGDLIVSASCAWFRNLYWLAGCGYGILSVDFPVTYQGKTERLDGALCPVIWEGSPDAIMTGREELGFPKMFADGRRHAVFKRYPTGRLWDIPAGRCRDWERPVTLIPAVRLFA